MLVLMVLINVTAGDVDCTDNNDSVPDTHTHTHSSMNYCLNGLEAFDTRWLNQRLL
jgi:hypothetical protein